MVFKRFVVIGAALLLAACGAPKPRGPESSVPTVVAGAGGAAAEASAEASAASKPPSGPGVYLIDRAQSELRLLVYRGAPMAKLGHNHVITNRAVSGWVRFTGRPTGASFALAVPVNEFVVDNAGARSQEGTDFFEEVDADAREGTWDNMMSPALLDGDHHPTIEVDSVSITESPGGYTATMAVKIAGHDATVTAPFLVATSAAQISASGIFKLRQSALGLKPFSIMLGALQVQDQITVKFTLIASVQ